MYKYASDLAEREFLYGEMVLYKELRTGFSGLTSALMTRRLSGIATVLSDDTSI